MVRAYDYLPDCSTVFLWSKYCGIYTSMYGRDFTFTCGHGSFARGRI